MKAIPMLCLPMWRRAAFAAIAVVTAAGLIAQDGSAQTAAQRGAIVRIRAQFVPQNGIEATTASLALPAGVAFDAAGNLYIADLNDNVVRKIRSCRDYYYDCRRWGAGLFR